MTRTWLVRHVSLVTAVIILAAFALATFGIIRSSEETRRNRTALLALCFQRNDLDKRIAVSKDLLRHHEGLIIFGIPRALIVSGLKQQEQTRKNLAILDCSKETP